MKKLSLLLCMVLGLWSCGDDDPIKEPEPTPGPDTEEHAPVIKIESATATENSVEIKFVVEDAERAVYKVILEDAVLPTVAELFADKEAVEVKGTGTVQKSGLDANKKYKVVAAASYGETMSKVATLSFVTNPSTVSISFLSALGTFQGRSAENGTATYIIDFSTDEFSVDGSIAHYPHSRLFVALSGDANDVDLNNLSIPVGTYTLGDNTAPAVGKFYAGGIEDGTPYNTYITTQKDATGEIGVDLIADGQIIISLAEGAGKYKVEAHFVYADGTKLEAAYEGSLVVDNASGELPPSEELPLPESSLTEDVVLDITMGYCFNQGVGHYGDSKNEYYLMMYDDNGACVDLFLIVDNLKYPEGKLQTGEYPVLPWTTFIWPDLSAIAGVHVKTNSDPDRWLGCNYAPDYLTKIALTEGKVEILSYNEETKQINLKFELKDNAIPAHTVSGVFQGEFE